MDILKMDFGVSGNENENISDVFKPHCDEVWVDALGNVIGKKNSKKDNALKIMIEAHMDTIGLMIKKVEDSGFLLFAPIGGIDPKILPASEVIVHGRKDIYGVISSVPPHLKDKDDKGIKITNMAIDTGMSDVRDFVRVGDVASFKQDTTSFLNNCVAGNALDNRAGLQVIKELLPVNSDADMYYVATVQEEVGERGAMTAAYTIAPDFAIVLDVTHGNSPDAPKDKTFDLGKGVVITIGPNVSRKLSKKLVEIAKKFEIPYQIDVDPGDTGTDAWVIQVAGNGVPCLLISIPCRYMHTTCEVISKDDIDSTVKLLRAFLEEGLECF